ncbi:MAG: hypothetical protein ACFCUL_15495 [Flavobacteriaceae bacterium]
MELDNIERLLEKYFEASTSVAEEEAIKAYFSQEQVAAHLEQYAPMFHYFSQGKEEQFTKQLPLTLNHVSVRKYRYKWLSVAAVAVLMVGIYFGRVYKSEQELTQKDLAEAEYAKKELRKALGLLAENFNRGTEKVAYLNEFEATKQKIYNNE